MAYQKIATKCTDSEQLISELKAFTLANSNFKDAGNFATGTMCLQGETGWYYNFTFSKTKIKTAITKNKPSSAININDRDRDALNNTSFNVCTTVHTEYPFVTRHFFSDGSLVVMVIETAQGVFRHHAFGKLSSYGNLDSGDFCGGTVTFYSYSSNNKVTGTGKVNDYSYVSSANFFHPFIASENYNTGYLSTYEYAYNWVRQGDVFFPTTGYNGYSGNYSNKTIVATNKNTPWINGYNSYNGRTMLYPLQFDTCKLYELANNTGQTISIRPTFYSNMVALLNIRYNLPEDIINNDWVCFPLVTKLENLADEISTTYYGVAYKK